MIRGLAFDEDGIKVTVFSDLIHLLVKIMGETVNLIDHLREWLLLGLGQTQKVRSHVVCIHPDHHGLILHLNAHLLLRLLVGASSWALALVQSILLNCKRVVGVFDHQRCHGCFHRRVL